MDITRAPQVLSGGNGPSITAFITNKQNMETTNKGDKK